MMKLKDWNESLLFANDLAEGLKADGVDVRVRPYTVYNGDKGIYLQVFDANGRFYREEATGIHDDLEMMKLFLRIAERTIRCYV